MIRSFAVAVGCLGMLTACGGGETASTAQSGSASPSVSASPTGPVVMTVEQAGARYMTLICSSNEAMDRFYATDYQYAALGAPLSEEARKAARKYAKANAVAARKMADPEYIWPESVAPMVKKVAAGLYEDSASVSAMLEDNEVALIDSGSMKPATRVRLELGLPPRGKGCKKYM